MDRRCAVPAPLRGRRRYREHETRHTEPDIGFDVPAIRAGWRRMSSARGWRYPDDWWSGQVDAVIIAAAAGADLAEPCAALGAGRADAGVGLDEALTDLWALFTVLHREPPVLAVGRFVEAYAESSSRGAPLTDCDEPLTGFASVPYLRRRLGEEYAAAAAGGRPVAARHGLLHVRTTGAAGRTDGWQDVGRRLALARVLDGVLAGGETVAALTPRDVLVLTRRPPDPAGRLRAALGPAYAVRPLTVPADLAGAVELIDHLAASDPRTRPDEHTDHAVGGEPR